jgi:hypothetical protein
MIKCKYSIIAFLILFAFPGFSQDIDELLNEANSNTTEEVLETFKSTHIIVGQSVERMKEGQLDFRISHHFGDINSGGYNFWGLDNGAQIHFGLDYGITNWLMAGIGRGNDQKTYDGQLKLSILRQSKGKKNIPVSVSLFTSAAYFTQKWTGKGTLPNLDRFSYCTQLLVGSKLTDEVSFEINPTYIHRNLVEYELDPNDVFALGAGGRIKLTKRTSINAEYYYVVPTQRRDIHSLKTYNPLSIGFDLETGGHVFQLYLSNSMAMIEKSFIAETSTSWLKGGIHFGFNISRTFALK